MSEYQRGFREGYSAAIEDYIDSGRYKAARRSPREISDFLGESEPKKKRRQSAKQKLLTEMAGKKWKSYQRKYPKGKKTYVTIRAEVSRSQAYKKKAKRLG